MWNYKSADDKRFIYIVRSFIHCFHCCLLLPPLAPCPLATMFALCNSRFMWSRVGGATLMYPIVPGGLSDYALQSKIYPQVDDVNDPERKSSKRIKMQMKMMK